MEDYTKDIVLYTSVSVFPVQAASVQNDALNNS